jgi:hypothetical protein
MISMKQYLAPTFTLALLGLTLAACDSTDPEENGGAGEQELITDVVLTFTPEGGGTAVVATATFDEAGVLQDIDTIELASGTTYAGAVRFLDAFNGEDITEEVEEEREAHRIFYTPGGGVVDRIVISGLDTDADGNPLGLQFVAAVSSGGPATGTLNVTLRHYEDEAGLPGDKIDDTGGAEVPGVIENDVDVDFPVSVQ